MFTRTKDRRDKIEYDLQVMSHNNNHTFNTPGNGTTLAYMNNPNIRLQKWGANIRTNMTEIEQDLRGLTRTLNRDVLNEYEYNKNAAISNPIAFETVSIKNENPNINENKCDIRNKCLKNNRDEYLHHNPQKNIRFIKPTSTRYVEKWQKSASVLQVS